jgi:hypothetical protein
VQRTLKGYWKIYIKNEEKTEVRKKRGKKSKNVSKFMLNLTIMIPKNGASESVGTTKWDFWRLSGSVVTP